MKFKNFKEFVAEKQTNPELVKKMQQFVEDDSANCPRCGKPEGVCICQDRDFGSTVNLHRLGKGEKTKGESILKKAANEAANILNR